MAKKWVINRQSDVLKCIDEAIKQDELQVSFVEDQACISAGLISRWKKKGTVPSFSTLLSLFEVLNLELVVQEKESCSKSDVNLSFLYQQETNPYLGLLEQKMRKSSSRLLHSNISKQTINLLLSDIIPLEDKKIISKVLALLLLSEELL